MSEVAAPEAPIPADIWIDGMLRSAGDRRGCWGRHVPQRLRTPASIFYNPKAHRGPRTRRATGPGSLSELDRVVAGILEADAADPARAALRGSASARKVAEAILHMRKPNNDR